MASMLPGVGVSPRKRLILMNHHHHHHHHYHQRSEDDDGSIHNPREQFETGMSTNTMDDTAARARKRLDLKLAYLHPSNFRSAKHQPNEIRSRRKNVTTFTHAAQAEEPCFASNLLKKLRRALPTQ